MTKTMPGQRRVTTKTIERLGLPIVKANGPVVDWLLKSAELLGRNIGESGHNWDAYTCGGLVIVSGKHAPAKYIDCSSVARECAKPLRMGRESRDEKILKLFRFKALREYFYYTTGLCAACRNIPANLKRDFVYDIERRRIDFFDYLPDNYCEIEGSCIFLSSVTAPAEGPLTVDRWEVAEDMAEEWIRKEEA